MGFEPAELFAEIKVDIRLFDDPDNLISFTARSQLLAHCVARTGCRHLGLLVGQYGGLDSLGMVGLLARYAPDVDSALQRVVRFLYLHVRGAVANLTREGKAIIFSYASYHPGAKATDQLGDGAVAIMFNILRSLCGSHWTPSALRFAHRKPTDLAPYQRFFKAPLVFDAEVNAVVFDAKWLSCPLPLPDESLHQSVQQKIRELETRKNLNFREQVQAMLRVAIINGDYSANQIAAMFSMSDRTLHRHLQRYGTTFKTLLEESRFEIAKQMLEASRLEVSQIALTLDYAEASPFIRAFKRWSGTTPARWRELHAV